MEFVCRGQLCVEQPGCSQHPPCCSRDLWRAYRQLSFGPPVPHPNVPNTSRHIQPHPQWCFSHGTHRRGFSFLLYECWTQQRAKLTLLQGFRAVFMDFLPCFVGFLPCFSCFFSHSLWWSASVISSFFWITAKRLKYPAESFFPSHHCLHCHPSIPVASAVFPGHS